VLIVGRMMSTERYKGHDQLLEAWPAVVAAVPRARLVCVGEGDDVERLKAKADELGVTTTTIFTGFVADGVRRSLYERAAVFAMPSRREGFGLVYLEAMAARRPCIGANHDAASEVIEDGVTGFLVDQADTRALASRIIQVLGDEDLRRRMGEAGFRRYRDEFTYESFSRRLLGQVRAARAVRAGARQVGMSPSDS
jgi:phosphatidylinositol alpha-1,6-mannosyltransferase